MSQSNRDHREFRDPGDARRTSLTVPLLAEKVALLEREFGVRDPEIMREVLMLLTRSNQSPEEPENAQRSFSDQI